MHVLVVEDDRALGAFLQKGVELEGHRVDWVEDGEAALAHAAIESPDLIVLDLSLPKRDGMEVLAELRACHSDASVLVLTGRNELDARVKCLDLGADDCLLKPFSFYELTARCRALLRRRERFADPILRCEDLQLNRLDRKVLRDGRAIDLTAKEYALLEYLLLHRGQCCSRSQLLTEVWQMPSEGGTNVVDVYINYLRRKLGAGTQENPTGGLTKAGLIQTVRGEGYRIGGPVALKKPPRGVAAQGVRAASCA